MNIIAACILIFLGLLLMEYYSSFGAGTMKRIRRQPDIEDKRRKEFERQQIKWREQRKILTEHNPNVSTESGLREHSYEASESSV